MQVLDEHGHVGSGVGSGVGSADADVVQVAVVAKGHDAGVVDAVQLVDDLNGLVVMYSAGAIFCYFLIQGYMRTLPFEVIEAAMLDGAGPFQIFWRVVLPLIRPILVTVGVFQTMWVWNDFIMPNVFLSSPDKRTIVLQVYTTVGEFRTDWPSFMTLSVIALVPMVIFFVITQRHIVSGLLAGSLKG